MPSTGSASALGVGHQAQDVAAVVADAGDVVWRAVRVAVGIEHPAGDVAEHDLVAVLERLELVGVAMKRPSPCATGTRMTSPSRRRG